MALIRPIPAKATGLFDYLIGKTIRVSTSSTVGSGSEVYIPLYGTTINITATIGDGSVVLVKSDNTTTSVTAGTADYSLTDVVGMKINSTGYSAAITVLINSLS